MIIFAGSNPSTAAKSLVPFTPDTKSGQVLAMWIMAAGIEDHVQLNVVNYTTENNKPLSVPQMKEAAHDIAQILNPHDKIVALGKTASKVLTMAGISHLELPHPSGRNRKLNCPFYVNECISKLRDYAYPG